MAEVYLITTHQDLSMQFDSLKQVKLGQSIGAVSVMQISYAKAFKSVFVRELKLAWQSQDKCCNLWCFS